MPYTHTDFLVETLGEPTVPSPISLADRGQFTSDEERILVKPTMETVTHAKNSGEIPNSFEVAGPRQKLFFDPTKIRAAIVTCGGLCPGLNSVVRALVHQLWDRYSCREILGVMHGYQGLSKKSEGEFWGLSPDSLDDIHLRGGTVLGTSRGTPPTHEMVDTLVANHVDMIFTIGGDGTMRGALAMAEEIKKRNLAISVIGIPKTIDNDIPFVRRTFGFETAMSLAVDAVRAAQVEASSVFRGVGLVKLMGRDSGYIAASACLAAGVADFCLVPEVNFKLDGKKGLLNLLEAKLKEKSHAVIVIAEGAGQEFFKDSEERDASGNKKLGNIGNFLREKIESHFKEQKNPVSLKYIDPSYMIRAGSANPGDQLFCSRLAQNAAHAAMAGRTAVLIGYWHGRMTHVPLKLLAHDRQKINPQGELWFNVLETTGQSSIIG